MTGCHGALQNRVVLSNLGWRFPPSRGHRGRQGFCFVLETIRTGAMRVIHITLKSDETQKLRIKFVPLLSYLNSNTTSVNRSMILITNESTILSVNRSKTLSTNKICHSICQQVDTSGRRSTSQVGNSGNKQNYHSICPQVHASGHRSSHSCLAVDNPNKVEEKLDLASLRARKLLAGP